MRIRTALAVVMAAAVVLAACGSDDSPEEAEGPAPGVESSDDETTETGTDTEPTATLPAALVELDVEVDVDVDVDEVYSRLCLAWRFDPGRDDGAINDAIESFLANEPDGGSRYSPDDLSDAVRRGCAEDSAVAGLSTALDTLSLTSPAIAQMIDDACLRYARTVDGEPGGQDFDVHISGVLGLGPTELTALVLDVCGADTFETYEEQLRQRLEDRRLPDPEAQPEVPAQPTSTLPPQDAETSQDATPET